MPTNIEEQAKIIRKFIVNDMGYNAIIEDQPNLFAARQVGPDKIAQTVRLISNKEKIGIIFVTGDIMKEGDENV